MGKPGGEWNQFYFCIRIGVGHELHDPEGSHYDDTPFVIARHDSAEAISGGIGLPRFARNDSGGVQIDGDNL